MSWQIGFVYGLIVVAVVLFFSGRVRLDLTAVMVIIALAVSGVVTPADAVAGFGNPLVILIAGLFVISEGLSRTGVAAWAGLKIASFANTSEMRLVLLLVPVVAVLSAFMSSTGVVALFVPVVLSLARETGTPAARLLMPLAIASLVGGMLTLIGTPPNLVVHRALVDAGLPGFGFFDFTMIGGVILVATLVYLVTVGRRLLPERVGASVVHGRKRLHEMAREFGIEDHLHRVQVQADSPLVDATVGEAGLRRHHGMTVIAVERHGMLLTSLQPVLIESRLHAGDILVVSATADATARGVAALGLVDLGFPHGMQRRYRESFGVAEALVIPGSPLIGKTLYQSNLRERQRLNVLSIRRGEGPLALDFEHTELQLGDILLVTGAWSDLERLSGPRRDMVLLEMPEEVAERTWHGNQAPWAVVITLVMLVLMVTETTSTLVAVMLAAFAMVVTGCVDMEEAYRSMNWQSLVLIAGMLPLAGALESTGGAGLIVAGLTTLFRDLGPHAILVGLFLITTLLSQFISNTATTVLIAPIALNLAIDLHYLPAPFLMTAAIAASTAFATPVASPVNTLILAPGQYSFGDFVRIGVPLQLIVLVVTVMLVPLVFPFSTA
ncbi:MAG: SLC13 family permease [Gammaproteobacteria bacterium]|nr:SLC13 family permease [Gammaproteobacteria bacterium]MCP5299458.1 SLC13 family permease [Chromatiaceae bacterium]